MSNIFPTPIVSLLSPNGNGQHQPKSSDIEKLPDPSTLRQIDFYALRRYAVGEPWEHPLINPDLAILLEAKVNITKLLDALGPSISTIVFGLDPYTLPPLRLTLDDFYQAHRRTADKRIMKEIAQQIISEAAHLDKAKFLEMTEYMREEVGLTRDFIHKWEQAVKEARRELSTQRQAEQKTKLQEFLLEKSQTDPSWPYSSLDGQMFYTGFTPRGEAVSHPIADFTAQIIETIQPEDGSPIHHITGATFTGKPFDLRIDADKFQDIPKLIGIFSAAIARDPRAGIAPGMAQHLPMAIHRLSAPDARNIQLYRRTGWANDRFMMPGRVLPGIQIDLISDLPYEFAVGANLKRGQEALMYLIASVDPRNSLPALMTFFAAPLANKIGLRDERYVTLIQGRTGKFKTSWSQTAMCLYGSGFIAERSLIKWGDGATTNAIEALASSAHDLPILLDNYKPNTGEGERGMIKLIHRMAEGGGRRRLDRNAALRPTADVYSWLVVTGEDTPQSDTATTARMLWINFDNQPEGADKKLAIAQKNSGHLSAIGQYWIEWLENTENQPLIETWQQKFSDLRQQYLEIILRINPEAINGNPRRIAQNIALNRLTWEILRHSGIGPYINFQKEYAEGIQSILRTMALATVQSNPGLIFVQALREMLATGRALLIDPSLPSISQLPEEAGSASAIPGVMPSPSPRPGLVGLNYTTAGDVARRIIGYVAPNDGAYLFPDLARAAVENLLGKDALAQATNNALYRRMDELGYIASKDKNGTLVTKKIEGKPKRVLHVNAAALESSFSTTSTSTGI